MASFTTFYLSRIIGNKIYSSSNIAIGKLQDLAIDLSFERPKVVAVKAKFGRQCLNLNIEHFTINKINGKYKVVCSHVEEIPHNQESSVYLVKNFLDKQIVDLDGRKLERVNDVRLAILSAGTFVVAVDVGMEGLFRRLSIAKPLKKIVSSFGGAVPGNLILWDDVSTLSFSNRDLKLSKEQSKLSLLHPSDLADIIEDLDMKTQIALFSGLDYDRAADVLEELETDAQITLLENISVEQAADVLERMPADEAADILDELEDDKAEEILNEMENEAREEVRELMEYPDNTVGSLMTTDFISFEEEMTVEETINELRLLRPESDMIYYLYVLDKHERLLAIVSLRDVIISTPKTQLSQIMNSGVISVYDTDKIDSLADIISKYNLLALPVVDAEEKMVGMVIIDDVVFTLLKARKKRF